MADPRDRIRNSKLGNLFVVAVVTILVIAGVYIVNQDRTGGGVEIDGEQTQGEYSAIETRGDAPPPEVGQPAPAFTALDLDGQPVVLERLEGPTWVVFNATWCSACRAETPDIQAVQDARGEEFNLVSVWVNEPRDVVAKYVERMGLDYVHVVDTTTEVASKYRTMGVPSHYFIDSDGVLQEIYVGGLSEAQMNDKLDALN